MNSNDLKYFSAVARSGAMNRAALDLNTVQSNVTSRIRQLEAELGVLLFARDSRGVSLTDAGRRLLPIADDIDRLMDEARRAVLDDGMPRGPLMLGSLETTAAYRLTPIITTFSATYPMIDLSIRTATNAVILADVREGRVDGAFAAGPISRQDFDQTALFTEELVVISDRRFESLDAALAHPDLTILIKSVGCSYRQRLEELLARRGLPLMRRIELGSIDAIFSCVASGVGLTMLPRSVARRSHEVAKFALHSLPDGQGRVETLFVTSRKARKSSALKAFLSHLQDHRATEHAA